MSSVKLTADSGGGTVELKDPSTTTSNAAKVITLSQNPGMITQVVQSSDTTSTGSFSLTTAGTYYDHTLMTVAITPASASNKILISCLGMGEGSEDDHKIRWRIKRAISGGATTYIQGTASGSRIPVISTISTSYHGDDNLTTPSTFGLSNYLDSPSTTSAITYTVQMESSSSSETWYYNSSKADNDEDYSERGISYITVMEVAG